MELDDCHSPMELSDCYSPAEMEVKDTAVKVVETKNEEEETAVNVVNPETDKEETVVNVVKPRYHEEETLEVKKWINISIKWTKEPLIQSFPVIYMIISFFMLSMSWVHQYLNINWQHASRILWNYMESLMFGREVQEFYGNTWKV